MAYLGLDCSTPYLALALYGDGLLASSCELVGRDHAARLPTSLSALLKEAELTPAHLGGVGVGVGPGSYTGLRVGVAAAKGIAQGLGIPLHGESTLAAMAAEVLTEQTRVVVALDARRGNVYAGVFNLRAGSSVQEPVQEGELTKLERTAAQNLAQSLDVPYFEGVPPAAGYLAQRAGQRAKQYAEQYAKRGAETGTNTVSPIYL